VLPDLPVHLDEYLTLGGFEDLLTAKNQDSYALLSVLYDNKVGQINYKKRDEPLEATFESIVNNYHRFRLEQDKQYIQDKPKYA
jgi:hypothetical protein